MECYLVRDKSAEYTWLNSKGSFGAYWHAKIFISKEEAIEKARFVGGLMIYLPEDSFCVLHGYKLGKNRLEK